jgi:hypothetical protein
LKWTIFHNPQWLLLAIFAAGFAAPSYGQGDTKAGDQLTEDLRNAPMTVTIAGSSVTLEAHVWSNRMPTPEAHTTAVRVGATLRFLGEANPGDITVSRLWAVPSNGEPLEASIVSSQTTRDGVRIAATVPLPEDLAANVWVVAELKDLAGHRLLIRSTETRIQKVR